MIVCSGPSSTLLDVVRQRIGTILLWCFLAYLFFAVFSTLYLNVETTRSGSAVLLGLTILLAIAAWKGGDKIERALLEAASAIDRLPATRLLALSIVLGSAARVLWAFLCPTTLPVEYGQYVELALKIVSGAPYVVNDQFAYLPPGMPLFLAPFYLLFGDRPFVPVIANLFLYAITVITLYRLVRTVHDERAAKIAVLLVTLWPNFLLQSNNPENELLVVPLLLLAFLFFRSGGDGRQGGRYLNPFAAGLTIGMIGLVQPPYILLAGAFIGIEFLGRRSFGTHAARASLLLVGVVLAVAPWSVRNYVVLGDVVALSSNAGMVLLKSNNPEATGQAPQSLDSPILPYLEVDATDEIARNKEAKRKAVAWIVQNPRDFAILVLKKQMYFLGEDDWGASRAQNYFVRDDAIYDEIWLKAMSTVSTLFWLMLLSIMAIFVIGLIRQDDRNEERRQFVLLCILAFFSVLTVYSVFESRGEYHLGFVGMFAFLASSAFLSRQAQEEKRATDPKLDMPRAALT